MRLIIQGVALSRINLVKGVGLTVNFVRILRLAVSFGGFPTGYKIGRAHV